MKFDRNALMASVNVMKGNEKKVLSGGASNIFTTEKFWKPETPKKGKAIYSIRFLPQMDMSKAHWVLALNHNCKDNKGGYINEMCPETFVENKGKCAICNAARPYFQGDDTDKKRGSEIWRKKNWVANILVVKDDRNGGENEGKVFMYRFGQKIYDKLDSALNPEPGKSQIFFIDPYKGYDFLLECKIQKDGKNEYPNYDGSEFAREETAIAKKEKDIDAILESQYDLEEEIWGDKNFKSLEELEDLAAKKLGTSSTSKPSAKPVDEEEEELDVEEDVPNFIPPKDEEDLDLDEESNEEEEEDWLSELED